MQVGLAVLLEEPLISPGGDDGLVRNGYGAVDAALAVPGVPDADAPGGAVGLGTQALDIAPQAHHGALDPGGFQNIRHPLGGVALADAAQVDALTLAKGSGPGFPVVADLLIVHQGHGTGQLRLCGDVVGLIVEAPELYHRIDGYVKEPVRILGQSQGFLKQVAGVLGQDEASPGVELRDFTVCRAGAEQGIQALNLPLCLCQSRVPAPAVGGELHHCVHRGEVHAAAFSGLRVGGAAGKQQSGKQKGQEVLFHGNPPKEKKSAENSRCLSWF